MDENELDALLREYGWSLRIRIRRNGILYAYAQKRQGTRIVDCYLAPMSRLNELTDAFVQGKLHHKLMKVAPKTETATKQRLLQSERCLVA